jgi:hypothetical protein
MKESRLKEEQLSATMKARCVQSVAVCAKPVVEYAATV